MKSAHSDADAPFFLIAEDDPDDQLLLLDALRENGLSEDCAAFVHNGDELLKALESLDGRRVLIIMDLNMPRKDGRETLRELKDHPAYGHIPVLILSTSSSEDDVRLAYRNGCNTFFVKPPVFNELVEIIGQVKVYWFEKAVLPAPARTPV